MKLLYVEDDPTMAKTVGMLLNQSGYEFDEAASGADAISLASSNAYSLILLDLMLPDIDGYEVIGRLRKTGINTPFLVQTGLLDRGDGSDKASLGVTEYLIKPFNKAELVSGIESVLERARQPEPPAPGPVEPEAPTLGGSQDERRRHRRFVSMKKAQVVSPDVIDCVILNMSHGGAALQVPYTEKRIPSRFRLNIGIGHDVDCEIRWRLGDKVGVTFET